MTIKEIAEELSLPINEQALKKLTLYNNRVIEIGKHINLTGIKTTEESLVKNVYDSLTVYEPDYFPTNSKLLDLGTGGRIPRYSFINHSRRFRCHSHGFHTKKAAVYRKDSA